MEVTLKTEVEAGASGFSVKGGGNEGIFIKKVLKESPASKIFSLREGDQLLSATIFFDNIKYEDALKILQYSEPYRVQFSLKRKIAVHEDLEHSTAQHKKERIGQEKELSESIPEETLHVSGKSISEEDRETLIVSQRVGRSKRPKKDRLSWPKFQSIKNKKILRHRRSHSTSDAYEPALQDISPTSTDTESQFPQEVHTKEKKGGQRKLKFPSIGFRMHRSKPEPQEKQKKEIKTTLISEREKMYKYDISLENPEILTVEYTTSPAYEMKTGEGHETLTKDLKEIKNGIPSHVKQCPEVEISIKKDKEASSKFSIPEVPDITTEIPKPSLETADLKESPTKKSPQASSKSRKKKQKGTAEKKDGESGINIDLMGHSTKGSVQVKGLEIGTAKVELQISEMMEKGEEQAEEDTQILNIQKINYGISVPKRKETETDTTKQESDVPQSVPEKTADMTSEDSRNFNVKTLLPDAQSDISTWKIQMPSFKVAKATKTDMKITGEERKEDTEDKIKKQRMEEDGMPTNDKALNVEIEMKRGEKDIEGKESKFRLPKLKFPTFTWSNTKEETTQVEADISGREVKVQTLENDGEPQVSGPPEKITVPGLETEIGVSMGKIDENNIIQKTEDQLPSPKKPSVKSSQIEIKTQDTKGKIQTSTTDIEIEKREFNRTSKAEFSENTPSNIKDPKADISLPSIDVTLPQASVDLQAPEASLSLEGEAKVPEKEATKTKDGKFKMPKFGMPSFGWSSSREAKGTVAAEVDVSLPEPQVTVPSGTTEVEVTLPAADIQVPGVEVTVETGTVAAEAEKGRFKMPDVKMPSVKLPKVKAPQAQVSLPKAEGSLPKSQEGEIALQGPEAEGSLEAAAGKAEGGGMKIHMPKVKVPSVVFSKPTIKSPKLEAEVSLPQAEIKATDTDITVTAPDVKLPSVEGSLELQAPDIDIKVPSAKGKLGLEGTGLKGKLKMPKFDKPKFTVSSPKAEVPTAEVSLPSAEVELPSATVTATAEDTGVKLEKPSLTMPKAEIKAPKVAISLPSVDVTLPQASVDLQAPEASLSLEGEAKVPEKEATKTKDGKFKMPKFGMPSFGWSSSREAKGTVAAEVDVSLPEPQVTVPSGTTEVEVTLPAADIQAPGVEVTVETGTVAAEAEKGRFKMPDVKMPSVKLPKVKAPQAQVSLPKAEGSLPKGLEGEVALQGPEAEGSLEAAAGKGEGGGMKIHMPKVKVPSVVFSKPTIKSPKLEADVSLPQAEIKATDADITVTAPDVKLPSVEGSLELQTPDIDIKVPSAEGKLGLEGTGLKGKLKMPKFDKPKFTVSSPKAEVPTAEVSLPSAEVELPSATVTAAAEDTGVKLEKPSLKMPKAEIKAPKVAISLPSVDVTLPQASIDLQAPEASLSLEGEAKVPEKEATKTKDGKFKMPKFGMPSFGWSSSREAKGTVAAEVDVSLPEPQVTVPSGTTEVEVTLPAADIQAPGVEVTVETGTVAAEAEKGRFKMPDVKMPSVKLPKVKAPQAQVSLPKAEVSLPKGLEGEVALQGPEAEGSLEAAAGKGEGGGMKIHMPKVKVPSVVFSKPTIKSPKLEADVSLPQAEIKATDADITVTAPDVKLPSVEGSLELQAPDIDIKVPSAEGKLGLEGTGLKGKLKMPKFDKPKFTVSSPKAEVPTAEVSLPSAEVELPSATVTATVEDTGVKLEKPSLKMPKADIKAPKVDISLPSVDVTLPQASIDLQAPEASLSLEGEAKVPEKEATKTKDGKFKMPKFGMPSFGWSSSREAKGTVAAEVDVSLPEPQVTVPSGTTEVEVTLPAADIQGPGVEVTVETGTVAAEAEKGRFKMPDVKMPSVKLPKVKAPQAQVSLPKAEVSLPKGLEGEVALQGPEAEGSLEAAAGKAEGGGMKIHMPKVKVPSVVFSKPTIKSPKLEADVSLPQAEIKATDADITVTAPDVKLPSVEGSLELQAPDIDIKVPSAEGKLGLEGTGLKGKLKMPKFDKPKFTVSSPKAEVPTAEVSLPSAEVELPSATVTATAEDTGVKLEKPSLKMPKAEIKAPKVDISLPSVDVTLPQASIDLQAPEASLSLEGEAKVPEKEATKTKDGKFKMPKFGMPSFGWSSSREAKGTVAAEVDVSLPEPQVTVPSGTTEVEVTLPAADIQAPGVEVTVETGTVAAEAEKGRFKMPDVKMPSVKLPKVKAPQAQVSLPKAEGSLPKGLEGEVALQGPEAEGSLEAAAGKGEGGGMKIHMPKVKVPSVVFSKPTIKSPKLEADVSLPQAEIKATDADITVTAPDVKLPSVEGSLELQAPDIDIKVPSAEGKLGLEGTGLKGKLKMPKFDKPKFTVSSPKAEVPTAEVSLPSAEVELPSATVTATVEDTGVKLEKPSLKMPKADIKAPKVDISLPSVDVTLPQASIDLQAPEASLSLEGEAKVPEKEATKTKDGKFKMPKFGMPSFGWSSSREAKGTVAAEVDVSLPEPQVTVPSGTTEVEVTLPAADIQAPGVEVTVETGTVAAEAEKGRFKMPDAKMPSVKLPKVKSSPGAVPSADGKLGLEGTGLKGKLKMPKFDKPKFTVSSPKAEVPTAEVSLPSAEVELPSATVTATAEDTGVKLEKPSLKMPKADIKAPKVDISLPSVDVTLPQASVELQAPEASLSLEGEAKVPEKEATKTKDGKFKMPKLGMPSFGWSSSREAKGTVAAEVDVSLPEPQVTVLSGTTGVEVTLPAADIQAPGVEVTVETGTVAAEAEKGQFKMPDVKMPSVKLPKVKAPQAQVSLPKAEVSLPKGLEGEVALQGPEAEGSLEAAAGKAEGGGMKIHMPKVKVPSVVFSKPTIKSPKLEADVSLPQAEINATDTDITVMAPDVKLPSVEGSLELQAPDIDIKVPSAEGKLGLEGTGLKGKLKMPKFDKPKFTVSSPKAEVPTAEVSLPSAEVELPSATVTAAAEDTGVKLEKPSLKMPKADIKAPKVDISLPSVDVTLPQASVDLQAPEASLTLEGEAKVPEKEATKTKDGKFKMPKFGMPSFGWSSSREAKGTVAAEVDVSLPEPQVTVPSGTTEVEVTLPRADIQAPGVEVTVETGTVAAEAEKGRFKMPDVKMPSVKLPKVKAPQAQVSLPKAEGSLPKGPEGEVALQGPEAEGSLEAAAGKAEGGGMKIHMPKVKVPSVVFSKPTIKSPKLEADVSLPQAEIKATDADITVTAPDVKLPSVEGSLELQAPDIDIKVPSAEGKLGLEGTGLKGKLKMPKFDKPKFTVSSPKPSLKMPKADIKTPKVDISLPSVDVTLPQASVDLQAPEASLSLEGEAKVPEKEATKTKDGKFKMPKFGMPSFGWSSSREAKGTVAAEVDVSLPEPQVTVPSGTTEVEVTLPAADIQAPGVEVTVETGTVAAEAEKGRFKMPDVKMPSVKLPKVKAPQAQVSLPKAEVSLPKGPEGEVALQGPEAEGSLEAAAGKAEGGGMKIHMPKVKVPSVVFSKPTIKSPKLEADVSLPQAEIKATDADITVTAPDVKLPSVEGSLELQAPDIDIKVPSAEGKLGLEGTGLKGKLKMPKFDKPKFTVSSPKAEVPTAEVSLPSAEVEHPSATVTATAEDTGVKLEKPSLKMPKADIKAPKVDISLPSVDVTLPQASIDLQAPEASLSLEGEAKVPEKEATKTKDGKFKMPKFGMPSFGWSSSREAKGTVAAEVDVSLPEPQVTVPSGTTEVEVTLPAADIQAPGVEVTVETGTVAAEAEKGRFKMPDIKMPSVKLPKIKAPQAQVSLPKAEVSLPKGLEGEVALQGPEAEGSLEAAAGKAEGGGMKIHMPKVKVPSVVFSKPTIKSPKLEADVSLPQAEIKATDADITVTAPDVKLPSVEGSLELQAPDIDIKVPSAEGKLGLEGTGLKGKLKMPKFDKPKFTVSSPKAEVPTAEVSLPSAEVELPSATVTASTEDTGVKLEKPSLKMPKADIKAPKVDISLPSVDVTLPQASVDLQAPEASLSLEGEAKVPEKEATKTKDGKFKMPKFGMPSFGWSSSREAKGTVGRDGAFGTTEVEVTLPAADIQGPGVEVTVETGTVAAEAEKGRFKMPDVKMPSVKLPKVKAPQAQVSLPKAEGSLPKGQEGEVALQGPEAEGSLEAAAGKAEGGGMKIHMPKVKVPSVVFSKPTIKSPKLEADVSLPQAEIKATDADITVTAPDVKLPSVEGSLELQAPDIDIKVPSPTSWGLEGTGLKGKLKMPKFDKPKFTVSSPKAEVPTAEVSLPSAEVELPSATVTASTEDTGVKLEKPSLKMPKADIKTPKVDISLPSVDVTLPQASVDLQAPEASLSLEGEAKVPEKEATKTKDGKFKMPKFGMPSFGWSSSREAKGTVAAEVDVSLPEPQVTVPSGTTEVEVTLPAADIQGPGVEVTVETGTVAAEAEKGRFKMPDVKMPSVKLPKVKAPQAQVSLPKAEGSLPKGPEGEVALQGPEAEGSLEAAAGKAEGGGMKIHMPKVKVPSVVFSKPTIKSPKLEADVSLPQAEIKATDADITVTAPDVKLPSVEGSLELQAPDIDIKVPSAEGKLGLEGTGLKGKLKMPKFDKPKFTVSSPKAEVPTAEVSLPSAEVELPSATVASTEDTGVKLEKPSLKMPKADIKTPKVDISLPSVDVTLPQASVDLQAPEASLSLEGEAKVPEKEATKTKDGKFKMPKFGMPSFGWSSSREAKGTVAAEVDVSLPEPQVTVPSGTTEVEVTLPAADIQGPGVEVTVETGTVAAEAEKGRFKMPDVKMPSVKLPKVKAPQAQVSLPKAEVSLPKGQEGEVALQGPEAEGSLEAAAGKAEGGGMKIHMPKVKVSPKLEADVSLPQAEIKATDADITVTAPDVKLPSVEGSLELQAPDIDIKVPSAEGKLGLEGTGLKGKLKMPKFDKPKFTVSSPKAEVPTAEVSLPSAEVELPSATVTASTEDTGVKLEKPSLKMPKADIKTPKVDISLPSVDVTLPQASVDLQAPEASLSLEGEAKVPEKEATKTKDGKFKMPKFGMPSFGWSSSREAKGTVAAEVDVSLPEPQVTVPSGTTEVEVTLPAADIQAPGVEVTVETGTVAAEAEKGRFKMPDVKMPSVKLPKVKAPQAQVSLPKAEVSLPKGQEGEVALQGPEAEGSLEAAAGKAEGGGMKIHMPKVKVPSVVFSKPTIKSPKLEADVSLPQAEIKATDADITVTAPDVKLPSVEGSLELQAPDIDIKVPSAEGKLGLEGTGLKGKLKMPKFDKPKFTVSSHKAEVPTAEVSLPSAEVEHPSATVTATPEDTGVKLEKPSLKMPKADIKAPKVDISLPSVDVTLPQAASTCRPLEASLSLEGEAKVPEKEATKTKDGKFKMPKFGMPSFGWSSSREAKGTVAAEVDVSLPEPQVTVPSGTTEVEVTLPAADIQAPGVEVTVETGTVAAEAEKGRFKMPDVKMPSVKLPKVKAPQAQVSLPKAEVSLPKGLEGEVALQGPEAEGSMKIHMPKVKVPSVVFSKPTIKSPKLEADVSLPQAEIKATDTDITVTAPDVKLPSVEGSLELQAPDIDIKVPSAEGKLGLEGTGLKGKLKMPKFDKPKFTVSSPKAEVPTAEVSLPSAEVELPSATVTATAEDTGVKLEKPSLKMPKADIKAPKVAISLPSVDVTLPQASVDLQAPEASLTLEGEAKVPEKEATKTKDGKFKMPKFGMPSFGWSSSREAKGTVAAEVDVSLPEPQVTVLSGTTEVEVTLPAADIQGPGVEVTVETGTVAAEAEKGRFKMPDVKMPSVKLPKVKAPQAQVSLPKAEVSLPKGPEGEVALQGPEAEGSLEAAAGKGEGGGMKIHMPKVKVPSVVFSKPTIKSPKLEADVSLPQAEINATDADITVTAPDVKLPSVEGSLELQAPDIDIKVPSAEGKLGLEGTGLKGKLKMPKFDKPKFTVSSHKAEVPTAEVSLPSAEVELPSATVTASTEGTGVKLEKPSLKMPKADIKAPKVDISLPSVDVTLPQASVDLQAPEASLSLEGEAKVPEKEATKTKDGKFKMPKFGMPSFGWSSSREAKGTVAAEVDVTPKEPHMTVPSGTAVMDMTFSDSEIQAPKFDFPLDSSTFKEEEVGKSKSSAFKIPKISLSKTFKPHTQSQSGCDVSVSETLCYSLTDEASLVPSESVEPKRFSDVMEESVSKSTKFRVPSIGFSKSEVTSSKTDLQSSIQKGDITLTKYQINLTESESKIASLADENLSDFEILSEDGSEEQGALRLDGKTTSAEISLVDTEVTVKIPKFRKPKFRIRSKGKASKCDIGSNVESEISKGRITSDMTGLDIEKPVQIPDAHLGVTLHKPSLEVVLDAPTMDPNLSPVEVTLPNLEAEIHGPDLECKAEQEVVTGEKGTEEKENKFKSSKFKLPSFRWSPKKEAIAPSHVEEHLEGPTFSTLSGDTGSELTFPTPENQYLHEEFDTTEQDGEKAKTKKSQFTMPKISFPKIKSQKVQVSLPVVETDVSGPKQEKEGVPVQKSEEGSSGEVAGLGIKVPKVTVPTSEFSKPEAKAPKIEMDISMPTGEVKVPACEGGELTLKSAAANASLSTSDIKMTPEGSLEVKSPDISVERTSSEIAVGDVEIKAEGSEGKTKMSKFQMPKVGITLSKGKGSEKNVGQSKSEVKVPQLKATVEISDIAVESPDLKVECGTETKTYSPEAKIKTSEADVHLPSADIPFPKTDSGIQDSDAAVKIKGEIKQDGDGEEKEGHFKMPKFKLPSFSWSPKKEASVKSDSGANLEDQKLAVMSSRIDTEVKEAATDDQGSGPDLDLEISAGKVEQKSPIKKPQFVMPKISLSKIKVPKSQKVEADATLPKTEIEGDDCIKIPDIEKCHPEGTEEGAQISIKLADTMVHTLEFSRVETEASKTEITVSSAKIDASLTPSEGSFQQVDLKISSTNECNIQKTGTKLPKGEASVDLKSPDILTESSSVVDGRKVKLEGPEGKIKMPKFQKTKFGISRTKGKVPETEISSPKIEAELPQLRTAKEIADIAVGVPASELISDMSDPGVVDGKIKTPQALMGGMEDAKVDISTRSVSKPKTEGVSESLEEKEIKLKEHEIKAEEVQTEEHQGWFKMPKFRIPAFGRSSLKEKKSDADIERSMEKAQATIPSAKVQTETSAPENTFSLPHAVAEITIGKDGIQKLEDSVKSSNVSLPKIEGDISLSTERTDSGVSIPKTETYADVLKRSAEGHTSEITVSAAELSKSYPSASETDKDKSSTHRFPMCTLTSPEHKGQSQDINVQKVESFMKLETSGIGCKPSSGEITLDATQKKIDVNLPKEELDIQNKEAAIKKGKIKGEVKITGKESEESQLKRTTCEWSTAKGSEDGTYVTAKLEDLKVEVPTLKTDVKITAVDPEMKFCVKSVEKDASAGVEVQVQVEDRAETSKIKPYKFKIPRFGMLHSEIKGFENDTNLPKSEADSAPKSERGTAEMQLQKPEGSTGLKSPALDHIEATARITGETVNQTQGIPEVSVRIPKLKIPRFTFRTPPIEADVLLSKVVTDPKGSSTDIEIVQLQASSAIPEETPGAVEGVIQKAKSKIMTLTEPDIKTAQMTATIESSLSSAGQDVHWSYIEGQEVSEKVEPEHVAIERCEIYTTEILKESEILSPEVKTATLGFSLLKAKLPESHSDLDVQVQQPSPTGDASVRKPTGAGESFGVAAQGSGSAELKLSDKPHSGSEESRGKVSLSKLKTSAAEVKGSSKLEESFPDKSPEGIIAAPLSEDEDVVEAVEGEEKDITNEKEKTDSKRSPGRFKFWLPSIGFSSPGDETSTDAKAEIKKSVPEDVKPADTSDDSSKQAEKAGWFRFPKLGFTSPSKKAKSVDKEEVGHKEGRLSDEDSPTDKPDVFFDAQESLSPKEIGEGEKAETDGASSIVTSSARTELILLEEEKDSKSNIVGDTAK
ncbi:LOW QUALITY PROTEIN: protein AHNAK2 [Camarhynchus parvulus]|uniref:LOW QUALITY PROTEIN: protein AHNAK2 n=1 Tax=Geospiza parvula TaxID=87175 RepID=UPI001237C27C|nr:LOW QUALITY PROTEIN: protein AHNAK2 [Camarhynchus parvulus]